MKPVKVSDMTYTYPSGKGIFDIEFSIEKGEALGYLGPNGAGKTTTLRVLMGLVTPKKGRAEILEYDCRRDTEPIQAKVGYLPGEIAFFSHMTGNAFLDFMGAMRGMKDFSRRRQLAGMFELDTNQKIKKMSKGTKQKLALITAFMHNPSVLLLDEPTSGLDPVMQNTFLDLVREEKRKGNAILYSSHRFDEVEKCCDKVGIIREGRIATIEPIQQLQKQRQEVFVVRISGRDDAKRLLSSGLNATALSENHIQVAVKDNYRDFFKVLSACDVTGLYQKTQTLEDVFMQYFNGEDLS